MTATASSTKNSSTAYQCVPAKCSATAYMISLIAKPVSETSMNRSAARMSGAPERGNVRCQWPLNETQKATIQPATFATSGDQANCDTSSITVPRCTAAAQQ